MRLRESAYIISKDKTLMFFSIRNKERCYLPHICVYKKMGIKKEGDNIWQIFNIDSLEGKTCARETH